MFSLKNAAICGLIAVLVTFAVLASSRVLQLGLYRTYYGVKYHQVENCQLINSDGLKGAEDIRVYGDYVFISADVHRRAMFFPSSYSPHCTVTERAAVINGNGSIILYNSVNKQATPMTLINYEGEDFHPHGIAIKSTDKGLYLYVTNHRSDGDYVDIFTVDIEKAELTHLHSMTHQLFRALNSIVPSSENEFYISNHLYYDIHTWPGYYETIFGSSWSYVLHCSFNSSKTETLVLANCERVGLPLSVANGLEISPDHRQLYVIESSGGRLIVYRISETDPRHLTVHHTVDVFSLCDNLDLDKTTGDLYTACHPNPLAFLQHASGSADAPSQVIRFRKNIHDKFVAEELLMHDGSILPASSVATYDPKRNIVYVGPVLSEGFLACSGLNPLPIHTLK